MVQTAAYESFRSFDSTTSDSNGGDNGVADRFNEELSYRDVKHFMDSQRTSDSSSGQSNSPSVADMLGDFTIEESGSSSSMTIWTDGKDGGRFFASGNGKPDNRAFDPRLAPLDEGNGSADVYFRNGKSEFSYDMIRMSSDGSSVAKSSTRPEEFAKAKPAGAGDGRRAPVEDSGVPNLSDNYARRVVEWSTYEEQQKAKAITDGIMSGKDVSKTINDLPRDERTKIMTLVKNELAKNGAGVVVYTNEDRSRDLFITTKDGAKVRITEDFFGQPKDIQVNGIGWRTALRAKDVYNQPAEVQQPSSSSPDVLMPYLRAQAAPAEGNGPLGRAMRGEELSPEDWKHLEELSRRSGGKVQIIRPMTDRR